ncbi:hypothetical protein V1521DRAFT_442627 [Lipomyces starkeyi]
MDPVTADLRAAAVINPHALYVGMVLQSVDQARQFVITYAIHHNFAVKNGFAKNEIRHYCCCVNAPKCHTTSESFR